MISNSGPERVLMAKPSSNCILAWTKCLEASFMRVSGVVDFLHRIVLKKDDAKSRFCMFFTKSGFRVIPSFDMQWFNTQC